MALRLAAIAATASAVQFSLDQSFQPLTGLKVERVTAVAIINGQIIAAQRGTSTPYIMTFDHSGTLLSAWSAGLDSPHGMQQANNGQIDSLWVADIANYTVNAYSPSGTLLGLLGIQGKGGNGTAPLQFSAPADIAVDNVTGTVYVSDGDGGDANRVVAFSASSGYGVVFITGGLGSAPGQFSSPHSVAWDPVNQAAWVADRGNNRLQALAGVGHPTAQPGSVLGVWNFTSCTNGGTPWGVRVDTARGLMHVADGTTGQAFVLALPTSIQAGQGVHSSLGPCTLLQALPVCPVGSPTAGCTPHELNFDAATGDVYVATVGTTGGPTELQRWTLAQAKKALRG